MRTSILNGIFPGSVGQSHPITGVKHKEIHSSSFHPILGKMMILILLVFIFQWWVTPVSAQEIPPVQDTIVEYEGQLFMPRYEAVIENSFFVAPEVTKLRIPSTNQLKKKMELCASFITNNGLVSVKKGLRIVLRGEITPVAHMVKPITWLPAHLKVSFFATLAKEHEPYWEVDPDAYIDIHFNNPGKLVGDPVINDIYIEPPCGFVSTGRTDFEKIHDHSRVVALKRNNPEFFIPVSREDFIMTLVSYFQTSIEKEEKQNPPFPSVSGVSAGSSAEETENLKFREYLQEIRKYDPELADDLEQVYLKSREKREGSLHDKENKGNVDRIIVLNTWREAVRKLKTELNAMTPLERKSQAWWSNTEDTNVSGLTPQWTSGSRPLVRLNKNLIDKSKPLSDIQLITVEWSIVPGTSFSDTNGYNLAYQTVSELGLHQELWDRLYSLLDN